MVNRDPIASSSTYAIFRRFSVPITRAHLCMMYRGIIITDNYYAGRLHTPFIRLRPEYLFREVQVNTAGIINVDASAHFEESYDLISWDSSTAT